MPILQNNLVGTILSMEAARRRGAAMLFLSTSRVYPIQRLNALAFRDAGTRLAWTAEEALPGFSSHGVAEEFPLDGPRSLYGATKLAAELLLQEYAYSYRMPVLINRCGILAGPWQMGKVDQGVVTLWVARHHFGLPLRYTGFGGEGKQVRDMLHVQDLFELLLLQARDLSCWDGRVYNVGGGTEVSASLAELTALCRGMTGREVPLGGDPTTSPVDLRIYLTDHRRVSRDYSWAPRHSVAQILDDILGWVRHNETHGPMNAMKLSVIIPAHNEEQNLPQVIGDLTARLQAEKIGYEIIVVNDNSSDGTHDVVCAQIRRDPCIRLVDRTPPNGFGRAIRSGLDAVTGDVVVPYMADASDHPQDAVAYYRKIQEGYDCVYGSRFIKGSHISDYPWLKRIINRIVNKCMQWVFWCPFNDLTNAFKAYRTEVIRECGPLHACHFNITIELSLAAVVRKYHIAQIPISWTGRT
jgi:nucleoside-diphosphate-sugar epimerase